MLFLHSKHGACCYPASIRDIALGYKRLCTKKSRGVYEISQNHFQIFLCFSNFFFRLEGKLSLLFKCRGFEVFSPADLPVQWGNPCASLVCLFFEGGRAVQGEPKLLSGDGCSLTHNPSHTAAAPLQVGQKTFRNWTFIRVFSFPPLALITHEIASKKN